jgi:hypothetical protein
MDLSLYLPDGTADYDYTLEIAPSKAVVHEYPARQVVVQADDGSSKVIDLGGAAYAVITLEWQYLTESEMDTLADLYLNASKANRLARSFYWKHPRDDTHKYVVRFAVPLSIAREAGHLYVSTGQVTLKATAKAAIV